MTARKVTLWGTSFAKPGDQLQLLAVEQAIRSMVEDADVVLFDRDRTGAQRCGTQLRLIRLRNVLKSAPRVASSDVLVIVGAPFFDQLRQLAACVYVLGIALLFRVPVIAYGITCFSFEHGWRRRVMGWLLSRARLITVREDAGLASLREVLGDGRAANVHRVADPRAALPIGGDGQLSSFGSDAEHAHGFIALTTRYLDQEMPRWVQQAQGYTPGGADHLLANVTELVARLTQLAPVIVIPMHPRPEHDQAMFDAIRRQVDDSSRLTMLSAPVSGLEFAGLVARARLVLSCRQVSTSLALALGTPVIAIAYDDRARAEMEEAGFVDRVFACHDLDVERAWQQVALIWADRDKAAEAQVSTRQKRRACDDRLLLEPFFGAAAVENGS